MSTFVLCTVCIAVMGIAAIAWAVLRIRDVLHPAAVLSPMVVFLYVYLPMELQAAGLLGPIESGNRDLGLVQLFNCACVGALLFGACSGSRAKGGLWRVTRTAHVDADVRRRSFRAGLVLGVLGLVAYVITLGNVGGIVDAYSVEKGGGTADSGYIRDAVSWCLPALGLMFIGVAGGKMTRVRLLALGAVAAPLIAHSLLSGRRGPTFVSFSLLAAGWYLSRGERPRVVTFFAGGFLLGCLLLLMVTFRESFRIGSDLFRDPGRTVPALMERFGARRAEQVERSLEGNEFLYGATVFEEVSRTNQFYWGRRVVATLLIRPIPRQWWPTKYEDAGLAQLEVNAGLTLGRPGQLQEALGAAPGFAADLYAEVSWGAILLSYLVGRLYAGAWRRCVIRGGLWTVIYLLLLSFSIFLILQTLEAILGRLAFTALPAVVLWRTYVAPDVRRLRNQAC